MDARRHGVQQQHLTMHARVHAAAVVLLFVVRVVILVHPALLQLALAQVQQPCSTGCCHGTLGCRSWRRRWWCQWRADGGRRCSGRWERLVLVWPGVAMRRRWGRRGGVEFGRRELGGGGDVAAVILRAMLVSMDDGVDVVDRLCCLLDGVASGPLNCAVVVLCRPGGAPLTLALLLLMVLLAVEARISRVRRIPPPTAIASGPDAACSVPCSVHALHRRTAFHRLQEFNLARINERQSPAHLSLRFRPLVLRQQTADTASVA